jgi:outer membrane protein TolC
MIRTFSLALLISAISFVQPGAPAQGSAPKAQQLPLSGSPQTGSVVSVPTPTTGGGGSGSVNAINSSIQVQGGYQGSVSGGSASAASKSLSLEEAVKMGMQYNLGVVGATTTEAASRAQRLSALAQMLPDVTAGVRESVQQINLAAQGFRISVPGFRIPTVVGPFNTFDARANFSEGFSLTALHNWRSTLDTVRAAQLSARDSRDLVALAVSGAYLQIIATAARIQSQEAQIETARAVNQQAIDRNRSGLNARIDVNRSQVELQNQQQRLTTLRTDFEKQKITLARLIGLPLAQSFTLSDTISTRDIPVPDIDDSIKHAMQDRSDVKAAQAQVHAAENAHKAAVAEAYPSIDVTADYGATGVTPSNQAHGTFSLTGAVRVPIFRSGRIRADIDQADAVVKQRKAEYEDARGRAEQEVRNALLDLAAASQQLKVAESNRALAAETLQQSRDRFRAGVADTVELVQAQESVASADQDFITAGYSLNLAQVSLARAMGETEQGVARLLRGK